MEQVLPGVALLVGEEALVWEDRGEEEWVEPERVQDPEENVCARNAERLLLMKEERRATL